MWQVSKFLNHEPFSDDFSFLYALGSTTPTLIIIALFERKKNKMQESCRSIKRKLHMTKGDYSVTELIVHSKILLPVQNT